MSGSRALKEAVRLARDCTGYPNALRECLGDGAPESIAGLQLADVLAHPVKQAMLAEKGHIPDPGNNFGRRLYHLVEEKLNQNYRSGKVEGYGKVWL